MNLDDFLDEVSDPDPKYGSPRSDLEENNPGAIGSRVFNPLANLGGFQLLDLIITELKSHMTC